MKKIKKYVVFMFIMLEGLSNSCEPDCLENLSGSKCEKVNCKYDYLECHPDVEKGYLGLYYLRTGIGLAVLYWPEPIAAAIYIDTGLNELSALILDEQEHTSFIKRVHALSLKVKQS